METVKGFKDFQGEEARKRKEIRKILEETFELYGFESAETPIVEYEEFVKGENSNDEAVSDIFRLEDRGKRKLALRYEFTFQLKRLMKNQKLPYKRYQIGPVFRDEPTTGNRFRQFTQCDVDVVGSTTNDEAEVLAISKKILEKLNIDAEITVNNRNLLNEILESEKIDKKNFVDVIREIDKLDKLPEKDIKENLKKYKAEKVISILNKDEDFFAKFKSYSEIRELKKICKSYGTKITFSPSLARGLSYYNGNVFEIKTKKMKETIIAGGSYMFNGIQATGISFGLDRLSAVAEISIENKTTLVISLNQDKESIRIAEKLRENKISSQVFFGKPSKALEYANSYKIKYVIFVGENEVKNKKVKLKNMETGKEKIASIEKIYDELKLS